MQGRAVVIGSILIPLVTLLFTGYLRLEGRIDVNRIALDSAVQDLRVEIRGNRLDLDNDLEIIDARLAQRINSIDSLFTQTMLDLNGTIERAAAQAHTHPQN